MSNISFYPSIILFIYVTLQFSSAEYAIKTSKMPGFSTYLIHRDSPDSPTYDPSINQTNRIAMSIRRSISILELANGKPKSKVENVVTTLMASNWHYLMQISIGTPAVKQWAIADIGSDLTWTQCKPCTNCYKQTEPLFDSRKSSTFQLLKCNSMTCQDMMSEVPNIKGKCDPLKSNTICDYRTQYDDKSGSAGVLAIEMFNLASKFAVKMVYGCGGNNHVKAVKGTVPAGRVGLGAGNHSFVGELPHRIGRKFSYCLTHWSKWRGRSNINFGAKATVSGVGVVSTPLIKKDSNSFYHVTLEAISVEKSRISFNGVVTSMEDGVTVTTSAMEYERKTIDKGNMIINTGTATTVVPVQMFTKLVTALRWSIKAEQVEAEGMSLCYKNIKTVKFPTIVFHFAGGANVAYVGLEKKNYMFQMPLGIWCLAMIPGPRNEGVFGSLLQMNYLIGFDFEREIVSFKPTRC